MSLTLYRKKRTLAKTPEPRGKKIKTNAPLSFVVQEHAASHLHYDFRLEMDGVLKSWAIPKGPSMNPEIKRLAIMVEDHPYDYRKFEGIIPKGNYGAGTVITWDEGSYEPAEENDNQKKQQEKNLLHQLHSGKIKFVLHGKKLRGEFALVKANARGENAWLLMKLNDKYASSTDITKQNKSVRSNKTIEELSEKNKNPTGKENSTDKEILLKGKKSAMPKNIKPMLATLVDESFDSDEWIYEIKWDGYRAVSYINGEKVDMRSRNELSFNKKFSSVANALKDWNVKAVVDGEVVAMNKKGVSDFQQLQNILKNGKDNSNLLYYVFDIIWYNGYDLKDIPLVERKKILQEIIPQDNDIIKYSDHIIGKGKSFFKEALKKGLEGVMAKKSDSVYAVGLRSKEWLKIKNNKRTEAIICGFTKGRNSRKYFGAVILGKYFGKELKYIGHSGSGFDEKNLKDIFQKLQPLITHRCPFKIKPKTNMPATWLKPELVCEVKFTEWTDVKSLRHPIFEGLREDKKTATEKNEKVAKAPPESSKKTDLVNHKKIIPSEKMKNTKSLSKDKPKQLLQADANEEQISVQGKELKFTNLNKVYWPKEKIAKRDLLNYYYEMMPYIFPHMKDRPQSLNRHPNGINKPNFYQKNVDGKVADWIKTYQYQSESDGEKKQFLVCADEATLLYIANLGCIEMNPWHSRIQSPENPDWCVIDLDPDNNPFSQVIETALEVKNVLDVAGIDGYCKTSGATGMHIYIPLGAKYSYDQSRMLAQLIVSIVHQKIPAFTSLERSPAKRRKKIYLDFLQNRTIQTLAAPYSVRPKPGATVSMPLYWEELEKEIRVQDFTIHNAYERVKQSGDIFKNVLGKGIDLRKTVNLLQKANGEE